ncbi:hypothetical protein ACEZCY_03490 [Streptacidiphilus sp. N1-12]|uniref:Uncharacterized protein n=2 Tax=Streptacidiphilus alkalitolerans TaxID=3342712 RepID=A0ABV6V3P2_9ACTN
MRKIAGFVMVAALSSAALGGITLTIAAAPSGHASTSSVVVADGSDTPPANPAPTPSPTDTHSNPNTWGWG